MAGFSLRINVPTGNISHWKGIFRSLHALIAEILAGRTRASALNHFWRERLSKSEKRQMILLLSSVIQQLHEDTSVDSYLREDLRKEDNSLKGRYRTIWNLLQRG
jgi:hypothetical protein